MNFSKDRSAGYLANHMARLFAQHLQRRIRPLGLATAQFPVLLALRDREAGLTQRELVDRLDIEQATVANTLARMERDGLIRRTAHPDDARSRLVRLTAKGSASCGPAIAEAAAVNELAFADLDGEERERFVALMGRVVENLRGSL